MWGQKRSANSTPQGHFMFSLGARNSRAHNTDGIQPAGPQWPWQAEAICHCKRAFTDYSFQISFHQNNFQKAAREILPAGLQLLNNHGQGQSSAYLSIRYLQFDSGAKTPATFMKKAEQSNVQYFSGSVLLYQIFFSLQNCMPLNFSLDVLLREVFLTHQQHIFSNCKGHL